MKTRSFRLLALVVLVNLQVYAQTFVTRNGKLTTIAAEAVSANGAIGAATVVGRDGKVSIPPPPPPPPPNSVFIAPGVSKEFMPHNLGANTALDPHTPVQGIHGNYYQWGRSIVVADATTPGGSIVGWDTTTAANGAWADGSKTVNDPCPAGFRVPTKAQWAGVIANNTVSRTSNNSWAAGEANFGSALHWGPDVSTKNLTLPAAGCRGNSNGALNFRGRGGSYWSSTEDGTNAYYLLFSSSFASTFNSYRSYGFSVRCVSE